MFDLKRKLMAVMIGCMLSVGVFGQKQDNPRPPKDREKVVVRDKEPRPPRNNNTPQPKKGDKKGRN